MTVMVIMIIMVVVMAIYHHITIICDGTGNGREVHSYDDVNYGGGDSNDGCGGYGDE